MSRKPLNNMGLRT